MREDKVSVLRREANTAQQQLDETEVAKQAAESEVKLLQKQKKRVEKRFVLKLHLTKCVQNCALCVFC